MAEEEQYKNGRELILRIIVMHTKVPKAHN